LSDVVNFYQSSAAGVSEEELARMLPVVHVNPERHFMHSGNFKDWKEPQKLVSVVDTIRALRKLGEKQQPGLHAYVSRETTYTYRMRMAVTEFPYQNCTGGIEYGAVCKGCELEYYAWENLPWQVSRDPQRLERIYTQEEFLEHFQSCRGAQELWRVSCEGTIPIPMEFIWLHAGGVRDETWPQWVHRG
jgi:hypothetical protein